MEGYNFKAWIKEEEVGGKCSFPHLTDVADATKILAVKKKKGQRHRAVKQKVFCFILPLYL